MEEISETEQILTLKNRLEQFKDNPTYKLVLSIQRKARLYEVSPVYLNPRCFKSMPFEAHFGGYFSTRSDWTFPMKLLEIVGTSLKQSLT